MDKKEKRARIQAITKRIGEIQELLATTEQWIERLERGIKGEVEEKNHNNYTLTTKVILGLQTNGGSFDHRRKLSGEKLTVVLTMFLIDEQKYLADMQKEQKELSAELQTLS